MVAVVPVIGEPVPDRELTKLIIHGGTECAKHRINCRAGINLHIFQPHGMQHISSVILREILIPDPGRVHMPAAFVIQGLIGDRKIAVQVIIDVIQLVPYRFLDPVRGGLQKPGSVIFLVPDLSDEYELTGVKELVSTGGLAEWQGIVRVARDSQVVAYDYPGDGGPRSIRILSRRPFRHRVSQGHVDVNVIQGIAACGPVEWWGIIAHGVYLHVPGALHVISYAIDIVRDAVGRIEIHSGLVDRIFAPGIVVNHKVGGAIGKGLFRTLQQTVYLLLGFG